MLSKEEVETCKEELLNYIEFMESAGDNAGWARGLKWYIEQLEASNMTATKCVSIQQNAYWQGYAERDKKAQQICKECKYRKKLKKLETRKQKLIEKLEEDNKRNKETVTYYEQARRDCKDESEYKKIYQNNINTLNAKREVRKEILEILKGEKE